MPRLLQLLVPFVVVLSTAACLPADAAALQVGDPAPPLVQGDYVKGEPVEAFEDGTVYVVEFWATWCGPCIDAFPHVTELQREHGDDVVFIGQNVWERDAAAVRPFVKKMGYRGALDDTSKNEAGAMASTWMEAAGQNGIPCSMIVDAAGKLAWIGHPMEMDGPLKQILAGEFDPAAEAARTDRLAALDVRIADAAEAGRVEDVLSLLDEVVAEAPELAGPVNAYRMSFLAENGREVEANALAAEVAGASDSAEELNELAWALVSPESVFENPDLDAALTAAEKANRLTGGGDPAVLDTLGRVHHTRGDTARAIALQEKAIERCDDPQLAALLQATLTEYRAAPGS